MLGRVAPSNEEKRECRLLRSATEPLLFWLGLSMRQLMPAVKATWKNFGQLCGEYDDRTGMSRELTFLRKEHPSVSLALPPVG